MFILRNVCVGLRKTLHMIINVNFYDEVPSFLMNRYYRYIFNVFSFYSSKRLSKKKKDVYARVHENNEWTIIYNEHIDCPVKKEKRLESQVQKKG